MFHDWFLTTSVIRLQKLIYYDCDFMDIVVNIYSEFDNSYYLISVIGDLEDQSRLI